MALEEQKEDMGSLFEGMILFNPSQTPPDDDHHPILHPPTSASLSSLPLDENLFSDLTLVTTSQTLTLQPQSDPSPTATTTATSSSSSSSSATAYPSVSRQVSRRKKRAGIRIGYGRDTPLPDDHQPSLPPSDFYSQHDKSPFYPIESDSPLPPHAQTPSSTVDIGVYDEGVFDSDISLPAEEPSHLNSDANSLPKFPIPSCGLTDSHPSPTVAVVIGTSDPDLKDGTSARVVNNDVLGGEDLVPPGAEPAVSPVVPSPTEEPGSSPEEKLEQIRARILEKLDDIRILAASVSATRKESAKRRRQAVDNVNLATIKYKQLEKELEEACEAEDFERAERVSESLAAAETEKQGHINALRDAEADYDSVDSKMQGVLELQIAAEQESVSLLEQFAKDAANSADLVLKNAELLSSKEMDEYLSSIEALEEKKMEVEIESHLVNAVRLGINDSIEHLIKDDRRDKELLCKKRDALTEELEELLTLVRQKEAEIAENDSNIQAVEKRITDAVSGFHDVQMSIDIKYDNLKSSLSRMESASETLCMKKKEIDNFLSQEGERGARLRELALVSADEAKTCQELVGLRKSLSLSILKSRKDKVRLSKTEEKILEDVQSLKQEVSAARASLQELSSTKSSIQQEIASYKQRIFFINKRGPELEAEKKVAATARNFKEAGRIAAESKALTIEKESIQIKMETAILELGKMEQEIEHTAISLQETEGLILSKEKEAAMARCERLRLVAAAATAERLAALELGDLEEAAVLITEVEAAETEATKLQRAYDFKEDEFGNLPKYFISLELITNLGGNQLATMAKSVHLSPT